MTLTELKYIVAVAREKHFGRAAESCFVSQPTLSVAVKKLEEELDIKIFERSSGEITTTPLGKDVVAQAEQVLQQAEFIHEIVRRGKDPLSAPLRLGIIYTIAPYLLPDLLKSSQQQYPNMPLLLQEGLTSELLERLRTGDIDCAILAEPVPGAAALAQAALYEEPFWVAVPAQHPLAARASIHSSDLQRQRMLLLGAGHCFRDHVLEVCPDSLRPAVAMPAGSAHSSFEGPSLETIKHMVAAGMGVTLVPALSVPANLHQASAQGAQALAEQQQGLIHYLPLAVADAEIAPARRVVLVWRRSFTRYEAIAALRNAIYACPLDGVRRLS